MSGFPVFQISDFGCVRETEALYVNSLEAHLKTHRFIEKPHRHDAYLMVFFTAGKGHHEIDFESFEVKRGSFFALQPGQVHHWELSEDTKGFIAIWPEAAYRMYFRQKEPSDYPFFSASDSSPEVIFPETEIKNVQPYFELLVREPEPLFQNDKALNLLDGILIEAARLHPQRKTRQATVYHQKIREFVQLIETHFRQEKSAAFYAGQLHITVKHLNRISKALLQKTATEVITARILLEAKRLLTDQSLNVSEIAEQIGFEDYSYFARLFKKQAGQSPSGFRNR